MQESARHLQMTRARQMRVDTRDLAEAFYVAICSWNRSAQDVRTGSSAHDDNKDAQSDTKDSDDNHK